VASLTDRADLPEEPPTTTSLPTGTVTFLFTDIEGSTRLLQRLGVAYPPLLARHNAVIRAAVAAHGGVEVKTEGDAFFVVFTRAADAIAAATDAQRALFAERWPTDATVRVRMGLHAGAGELSEGDYVGIDVHRAARVSAAAHGGQLLITEPVRVLVGALPPNATLRDLGEHELKDFPAPERLFQVDIDGLPLEFPPLRTLTARRGNLPEPPTSFVGRQEELDALTALAGRSRLVTLTGPGGTGKTRLSIEAARRMSRGFPDGAWFVPLEHVRDPQMVLPEVATTLGIPERPGHSREADLRDHLAGRSTLVVLDNLEQVVSAAPRISGLVAAAPQLCLLASSREPLRISGEQEFPVPPLSEVPAVELFLQRALQVRPDFVPDAEALAAIRRICAALDGLPLAIELAAARIRVLTPLQIEERLGDRLRLLASSSRDLPGRQRTLRGAIEWSHDLLQPDERTFFARLGVFAAAPDLAAVEAIVDPAGEMDVFALDAVESLVEKNLVRRIDVAGTARFGMLESIRAFAREQLGLAGESAELQARHADHYVATAQQVSLRLLDRENRSLFEVLEADHDEYRAVLEWAIRTDRPEIGMRLGFALWRFWQQQGHLAEGRRNLQRLLAMPGAQATTPDRVHGLAALGGVEYWQGDIAATRATYEDALATARELDDSRLIAESLYDLGFPVAIGGEPELARPMQQEAFDRYLALGDTAKADTVREAQAVLEVMTGNLAKALEIELSVIDSYRRAGHHYKLADGLSLLALVSLKMDDLPAARRSHAEAVATSLRIGDLSLLATGLQLGALLAIVGGRIERAAELVGALEAFQDERGPFLLPALTLGMEDPAVTVRERLTPDVLDAAFARGRQTPVEQLLQELVDEVEG
jgi:predicted ATPase/class 3 adenylate cyclase